jgi:hypothetical protein
MLELQHEKWAFASYPIGRPPRGLLVLLVPQLFGLRAYAHAVADFLDAHVLEVGLVHLHEVLAVDVVVCGGQDASMERDDVLTLEQLDILAAVDALQPVGHLVFVPMSAHVSFTRSGTQGNLTYLTASGAS